MLALRQHLEETTPLPSPVVAQADEKLVTERAFANPKFVEDVVRDTIIGLREVPGAVWYSAECQSFESIHNHVAYAYAESSS